VQFLNDINAVTHDEQKDVFLTLVAPTTYRLQLLHYSDSEAGFLAPQTAPYLAALVDGFDDTQANTLILAGGDNYIASPSSMAEPTSACVTS
jgi:2',3'-cyclic-nucleotide 2'-phosphodiesterase (5'-nucleotidase family)